MSGKDKDWRNWCDSDCPEEENMPGGIDNKLNEFQKLLMIISPRPLNN